METGNYNAYLNYSNPFQFFRSLSGAMVRQIQRLARQIGYEHRIIGSSECLFMVAWCTKFFISIFKRSNTEAETTTFIKTEKGTFIPPPLPFMQGYPTNHFNAGPFFLHNKGASLMPLCPKCFKLIPHLHTDLYLEKYSSMQIGSISLQNWILYPNYDGHT